MNVPQRFVIFGAWDQHTEGARAMILSDTWVRSRRGIQSPGYTQAREHIRLVEEEGYELKTFPMILSDEIRDVDPDGPAKIRGFRSELATKRLVRDGDAWYAVSP